MKYIIIDTKGHKLAAIFSEALNHDLVAACIAAAVRLQVPTAEPVVWGAGFVDPVTISAHGKSETLNIESKPEDLPYLALGDAIAHTPPLEAMAFYNHLTGLKK